LAIIDLPHPGGPYNRTPFGAVRREEEPKSSGWVRGKITDSRSEVIIFSRPPISREGVKDTSSRRQELHTGKANSYVIRVDETRSNGP